MLKFVALLDSSPLVADKLEVNQNVRITGSLFLPILWKLVKIALPLACGVNFYEFPQHIILLHVLNLSKNIFPPQNFGLSVTQIAVSFQFDLSKIQMLSISFYYQFPPSTVLTSMLRSHGSCSLDFTIFCQEKHLYDFFLTPFLSVILQNCLQLVVSPVNLSHLFHSIISPFWLSKWD